MSDGQLPLSALTQALTPMPPAANGQAAPPAAIPPPDFSQAAQTPIAGAGPGGATSATPQQGPDQNQIPTKMSAAPLLARVLQSAFGKQTQDQRGYGPATGGAGDIGAQPGRPISRTDQFEGFLGEFLDSFSKGMANAGAGPAANARGFGAAVQAPYQQAVQQYQMGQEQQERQAQIGQTQAETALKEGQAQKVPVQPYGPNGPTVYMLPADAKSSYAAGITGQAKIAAAQVDRYKMGPFGVYDQETGKIMGGTGVGGGMMGVSKVTPEMIQNGANPDWIGTNQKNSDIVAAMNAKSRREKMVTGEFGPAVYDTGTGQTTSLGIGNQGLGRPVQVGDPNNPGNVNYATGGQAVRGGMTAPGSASVTVPAASLRYMTSGPGGQMMTAYRTATNHSEILMNLGRALESGDYPRINAAKQSWQTETGSAAPGNFQLVRSALADEASKAFSGQGTVSGSQDMRENIMKAPNMDQLEGMVQTMHALMQGKADELQKQHEAAMKGKPVFASPTTAPTPNDAAAANAFLLKHPPAQPKK